jgi:hypothetical protein
LFPGTHVPPFKLAQLKTEHFSGRTIAAKTIAFNSFVASFYAIGASIKEL